MPNTSTKTLFEALGGTRTVREVVKAFYKRVMTDDNLSGFFLNTDMVHQTEQQIKFISMALGGPTQYRGRNMKDAHENLAITELHFGLVAGHLQDALKEVGVPQKQIDEVMGLVGPLKKDIVTG
ncbi:MAG: group I truncated hemoglobin [Planctomycetota bacterium]|jgi:hemoglobin